MRKYLFAYAVSLQNSLQMRASLLMDRIGGLAMLLTLYFFWSALLPGRGNFLGYDRSQMLSYVLAMNLLRSFVFTGRGWNLVHEISMGRISGYLLRPIDYRVYSLALDLGQKTIHVTAALLEILIFVWLMDAPVYLPRSLRTWILFAVSVLLSSLIFFFMEFTVSSLAFWTSESGGPLFCFGLFLQFTAGAFFPLDVLPQPIQSALYLTPFPYMAFFPIHIYLERVSMPQSLQILALEVIWLGLVLLASRAIWQRGLTYYAAEGG